MVSRQWRIRLTDAAQRDFEGIIDWTASTFGPRQAQRYARVINAAISSLASGPGVAGIQVREDLPAGLRLLAITRRGARARHVLVFRTRGASLVEVVRILHVAMDTARHLESQ
jgi:toxin ParE1/3/4